MKSSDMFKQLGELLSQAWNTYNKLQQAHSKVQMIRQRQANYHRTVLLQKLKISDQLNKIYNQNSQILEAIQSQSYTGLAQQCNQNRLPPKPFSQHEQFRNDLTPKATVSAQPPGYKQVVPIQYV